MTYAAETKVSIEASRAELERMLMKYGADRFAQFLTPEKAMVVFEASDRRLKFDLPLEQVKKPTTTREQRKCDQTNRARWRALLLCIKAKLEAVDSGIETFEEAFLAHVVMPDGQTVAEHASPMIKQVYDGGSMQPLLPDLTNKRKRT